MTGCTKGKEVVHLIRHVLNDVFTARLAMVDVQLPTAWVRRCATHTTCVVSRNDLTANLLPAATMLQPRPAPVVVVVGADPEGAGTLIRAKASAYFDVAGVGAKLIPTVLAGNLNPRSQADVATLPRTMKDPPVGVLKLLAAHLAIDTPSVGFHPLRVALRRAKVVLGGLLHNIAGALKLHAAPRTGVRLGPYHRGVMTSLVTVDSCGPVGLEFLTTLGASLEHR